MKPLDASEVVLLVVEHADVDEAIALRDASRHAIMPMDATEESRASLLIAMGARNGQFDVRRSRYGNVCVAPAQRQAALIACVAAAVWSVVEAGWLYAFEPPYEPGRARSVSVGEAQAALGDLKG